MKFISSVEQDIIINMKFISSVEQDISRVSEANEWDILLSTRNKFHISKHPCNILFISETFTKKSKFSLQTKWAKEAVL